MEKSTLVITFLLAAAITTSGCLSSSENPETDKNNTNGSMQPTNYSNTSNVTIEKSNRTFINWTYISRAENVSQCTLVHSNHCPCHEGGRKRAINEKYLDEYHNWYESNRPETIACTTEYRCRNYSVTLKNGLCTKTLTPKDQKEKQD